MPSLVIPPLLGMNTRDSKPLPGQWELAQNVQALTGAPGSEIILRDGIAKLNATAIAQATCYGLFAWRDSGGTVRQLYAGSSNVYYSGDWTTALTKTAPQDTWTWARADIFQFIYHEQTGQVYMVNGKGGDFGTNPRFDGTDIHPTGGKAPAAAPVVAAGAAGNLTGAYRAVYTHYSSTRGIETDPSPVSAEQDLTAEKLAVTMIANTDTAFDQFRIYRTRASGERYFLEVTTAVNPYSCDTTDANLTGDEVGEAGEDKDSIGEVCRCIWEVPDGRIAIANGVTSGLKKRIWTSYDKDTPESFPDYCDAGAENGAAILVGLKMGDDSAVICEDGVWVMDTTCSTCRRHPTAVGGVGPWCAAEVPGRGVVYASWRGIHLLTGSTVRRVSAALDPTWAALEDDWLYYCSVIYDPVSEQVLVSVCETAAGTVNDVVYALDVRTLDWKDPRWVRFSLRLDATACNSAIRPQDRVVYGALAGSGHICNLHSGTNDAAGTSGTRSGTATAGAAATLTDTGASFYIIGSCLKGVSLDIVAETGAGQTREISSNTATELTVSVAWSVIPDDTSEYAVGLIDLKLHGGEIDCGFPNLTKRFTDLQLELEQ